MKITLRTTLILIFCLSSLANADSHSSPSNLEAARGEMKQIENRFDDDINIISIDSGFTLKDYLQLAAKNNPQLKAAFYGWKRNLEKTGYAGSLPDPKIIYGYFIEKIETRVGPQNQKFGLRQQIPWFGSLGDKKNIAFEESNVSFKKFQSEFLKLSYRLKSAYFDLYLLGREIEITRDNIVLLEFWESVARTKYKVALKQHPDIIKAQVELGILEDRLITLEAKLKPTRAKLISLINAPDTAFVTIPETIEIEEVPAGDKNYITEIIKNNPDLRAVKHAIEKEKHALSLANKSSLPGFTFGIDYIETEDAINPSMLDSGKDPWVASVEINLPLWFGKNKAIKKEAEARKKSVEYMLKDKENQLVAVTENIIFEHDDALRKVQLYRDGLIPKAEQSLNATYTAYQAGETDFLNLLDAQRQFLEFQLMLDKAKTNLIKRKAELDMLRGIELANL